MFQNFELFIFEVKINKINGAWDMFCVNPRRVSKDDETVGGELNKLVCTLNA